MKLSELEIENFKIKEPALSIYSDEEISSIVYDGVLDNKKNNDWVIVFGNSNQIQERIKTVYESYCDGRFKNIILCGGTNGISNDGSHVKSEAQRMKDGLLNLGISESIIFMDERSQNTFENIENAFTIILEKGDMPTSVSVISGEYHLKRCLLALNKMYPNIAITTIPSYDGYADKNNWTSSQNEWNSGRCMVTWERNLLTKYAKEGKIRDVDVSIQKLSIVKKIK